MNEFTEHHAKLTDKELIRIAYFDRRKYKKEARKSAKEILKQRNLSKEKIEFLKNEIRRIKRKERKDKLSAKNESYGFLDFIVELIFHR